MCVGIPMRLAAVQGEMGTVEESGVSLEISLALLDKAAVGDYVLVHAGYAIEVIDAEEAQVTLDLLRQVGIIRSKES